MKPKLADDGVRGKAGPPMDLALAEAERMAGELRKRSVGRADLRSVLSLLFTGGATWSDRLQRTASLVNGLPSTWLGKRPGQSRSKLEAVGGPRIVAVRSVGYRIEADEPA